MATEEKRQRGAPKASIAERFATMAAMQALWMASGEDNRYGLRRILLAQEGARGTLRDGMIYRYLKGERPREFEQLLSTYPRALAALKHPLWKMLANTEKDYSVAERAMRYDIPAEIHQTLCGERDAYFYDSSCDSPQQFGAALLRLRRHNDLNGLAAAICLAQMSYLSKGETEYFDGHMERYDLCRYSILRRLNALFLDDVTQSFALNVSVFIRNQFGGENDFAILREHKIPFRSVLRQSKAKLNQLRADLKPELCWTELPWFPWGPSGHTLEEIEVDATIRFLRRNLSP